MKKGKILVCMVSLVALCLTGCGAGKTVKIGDKYIYNKTTDLASVQTITGEKPEDITTNEAWKNDKYTGISIKFTDTMMSLGEQMDCGNDDVGDSIVFCSADATERLDDLIMKMDSLTTDELMTAAATIQEDICNLYGFYILPDDQKDSAMELLKSYYQNVEELGQYEQNTYVFVYNTDFSSVSGLTEEEVAQVQKMVEEKDQIFNSICFYETVEDPAVTGNMSKFTTQTLDGETIDQSIFADYDLTVVNIWATWCPSCIRELPELAELKEDLPENVNIISICTDANTEGDLAREIVQKNNITYKTLLPNDEINNGILLNLSSWPTTVYLDKNGNMVGEATVGVPSPDAAKEAYLGIIEERLNSLK